MRQASLDDVIERAVLHALPPGLLEQARSWSTFVLYLGERWREHVVDPAIDPRTSAYEGSAAGLQTAVKPPYSTGSPRHNSDRGDCAAPMR